MGASSTSLPISRRRALAAVRALTVAGVLSLATAGAASAATPQCGSRCISVFSSELGTTAQPNFVEAVLADGAAIVGRPVGLKAASRFDPTQDIQPRLAKVSDFYAMGLASAAANRQYGSLDAVQQRYAPFGIPTELCVGLANVAQKEGLTLQPCTAATTVWIPYTALATADGYFPIINAATRDFDRPFAMHLPRNRIASGRPLQMQARRLQFRTGEKILPARQLWGVVPGVLN